MAAVGVHLTDQDHHDLVFDHLRSAALSDDDSAKLIAKLVQSTS